MESADSTEGNGGGLFWMMNFLNSRLEKVNREAASVSSSNNRIAEQTQVVLEAVVDKSNGIRISRPIPKLYRDQYAIWFEVENEGSIGFTNFTFSLHWNSNEELTYVSSMHPVINDKTTLNDSLVYLEKLTKKALLVILIDRPLFVNELSVDINGILSYTDELGGTYVDDISTIVIGSEDITEETVDLPPFENDRDILNFHTRLLCSFKVDLVIQMKTQHNLRRLLERAGLIPLNPLQGLPTRFYVIHGKSHLFDGTILEVLFTVDISDVSDISVYTKDVDCLLAVFHYLYQKMCPHCLLPSEYKIRIPSEWEIGFDGYLSECIAKEIDTLRSLTVRENFDDYKNIRRDLLEQEYVTDMAFVKWLVARDKHETVEDNEEDMEL